MTFSFDSWWVILKILETATSAVSAQWRKSRKTACSDNSGTPYTSKEFVWHHFSGGPNNSLIKVYILEYAFTSSRQSTVRIVIVNRTSYRIAPAEPRRISVPPAESHRERVKTSTDAWSPVLFHRRRHRHVVAGNRTGDTCWSGPARRTSIAGRQHTRFLSNTRDYQWLANTWSNTYQYFALNSSLFPQRMQSI